ncbi:TrbI/VirB10 family protein [Vibrio tubiashii]|uniref:Conjugal transfer protein n=1 Tax=Vibrio tubiashii ATCC 19109 TaxID=1051646 RepID=F9T6U4_9VIBR|nr:TrbI/VirB10 family protein [Vibrio tubiashii]AIW17507.1 conjugal transfer protein [Vibrio tubiashii ATCC 19109]EGU54499.1 conjugal transfer protein [Vibrio tubiashii ATCC 19109]EIF01278.1 conjugal transfer protein [Vibrio tubiashii NCIMB 1337 = ATCC 19106]
MNDKVSSLTSKVDRSELNVNGIKSSKKKWFLFAGVLLFLVSLVVAISVAKSRFEAAVSFNDESGKEETLNYEKGANKTSIDHNPNWLEKARNNFKAKTAPPPPPKAKPEPKPQQVKETKKEEVKKDVEQYVNRPEPKVTYTNSNPPLRTQENEPPPPTQEEIDLQRRLAGSLSASLEESSQNVNPDDYLDEGSAQNYDDSFDGSVFEPGRASVRPKGARDFILSHGSSIPCALYTQIISDYDGFVTCRVTQDVYSSNGAVLLVERGSLVSGTQKVAMELGKSRVFTNWGEIETPEGVIVRINSLGTGQLGAAGNKVWVDNHYFERFSGAIMLSFVDDALATAVDSVSGNVVTSSSVDNVGNIAEEVLSKNLNIAPTGYTQIGQRINIMVVRDVDFSTVYRLEGF